MTSGNANNPVPNFYRASADDFRKIPGSPIAYWVSEKFRSLFCEDQLYNFTESGGRCKTHNDELYVRMIWETSKNRIGTTNFWKLYNKGGPSRKWYGNLDYLIKWTEDAKIKYSQSGGLSNQSTWNRIGITWSGISSRKTAYRIKIKESEYSSASPTILSSEKLSNNNILGFLNTKISFQAMMLINPTMQVNVGDALKLPSKMIISGDTIEKNVDSLINLAKTDWDSYETSWDFESLPLLSPEYKSPTIKETYTKLRSHWREMTLEMQRLEEENNRIFIEAYGLEDELTPDVPLSEITLTCNPHYRYGGKRNEEELEALLLKDTVKELISYAVGCMFGRYSLDKPGLILANQGEKKDDYLAQVPEPSFRPDDDNIIPVLDDEYFTDDIVSRFMEFLKTTFGKETLSKNLDFIAAALTGKSSASPEETIRDYFIRDFYKDHARTYKKRPIYWMFSSGKNQGFNALIYIHRYDKTTLAKMRTDYLLELESKLYAEVKVLPEETERNKARLAKIKKQIEEMQKYDELLNNKALSLIEIDLDDGVKVNYEKFEGLVREI
ncbi:BREX-1 system adenine-specific DNA-methyltransferase PglX [Methanolacinia paynteri]|uniref:BREX-1 system adenine-specific DNA-methyltransferase PglX n=1 Tax=Methanolacinia paynteri TaxID=230356 RepID=UPI00064EE993|nr:BREX-1 system adenine-specific DNA-methyltransferase PglX [Methanolacinia paynteri]